MDLDATAAVVTGGASGLGAATAELFTASGAEVFVFDLPGSIAAAHHVDGVTYLPVDVADTTQVRRAMARVGETTHALRAVVNCAGIAPSHRLVESDGAYDFDLFAKVVTINLIGTFQVTALGAECMAQNQPDAGGQRGVVINTASITAFEGRIGHVAYASSKAGIVGMALPAARDLARHGIRVMTIAPGVMLTPMLAQKSAEFRAAVADDVPFPRRPGEPIEFAKLARSIVENDYLNGEVIRMDGAMRLGA